MGRARMCELVLPHTLSARARHERIPGISGSSKFSPLSLESTISAGTPLEDAGLQSSTLVQVAIELRPFPVPLREPNCGHGDCRAPKVLCTFGSLDPPTGEGRTSSVLASRASSVLNRGAWRLQPI